MSDTPSRMDEVLEEFVATAEAVSDRTRRRSVFLHPSRSWEYRADEVKRTRQAAVERRQRIDVRLHDVGWLRPRPSLAPDPTVVRATCPRCGGSVEERTGSPRIYHVLEQERLGTDRCPVDEGRRT